MQREQWFKAFEGGKLSTQVVGRFIDGEVVDPIASAKVDKNVWKTVPMLESKIVGSHEVSTQRVKNGSAGNLEELSARFPGAWDHYQAFKSAPAAEGEPIVSASGTPIEELDFIRIADGMDSIGIDFLEFCQNLGISENIDIRSVKRLMEELLLSS